MKFPIVMKLYTFLFCCLSVIEYRLVRLAKVRSPSDDISVRRDLSGSEIKCWMSAGHAQTDPQHMVEDRSTNSCRVSEGEPAGTHVTVSTPEGCNGTKSFFSAFSLHLFIYCIRANLHHNVYESSKRR